MPATLIPLPRRVSSRRAAAILHRVFGRVATGLAFQLWDGTLVSLGSTAPVCTAVVHRPETFIRLLSDPTPLNFAEAYVDGAIDLEGDLFAVMSVADEMDELPLTLGERLRILLALWRG